MTGEVIGQEYFDELILTQPFHIYVNNYLKVMYYFDNITFPCISAQLSQIQVIILIKCGQIKESEQNIGSVIYLLIQISSVNFWVQ